MTDAEAGRTRDFLGYGRQPPDPRWPNGAHVAVNFVINYEEGGEYSVSDGDPVSEAALTEGATAAVADVKNKMAPPATHARSHPAMNRVIAPPCPLGKLRSTQRGSG